MKGISMSKVLNYKKFLYSLLLIVPLFSISTFGYDFGDLKSSTLASKAWNALNIKEWAALDAYVEKCIALYSKEAAKQQASLKDFAKTEIASQYWALNDVGTCLFIKAKGFSLQGKIDEAKKTCEMIQKDYGFAQCFDPANNSFWKIADASKDLLVGIDSGIDFEDYTSETLLRKGWESLSGNNIPHALIYAQKCITLYGAEADKQQATLTTYASKDQAFNYWALNDVGTAYFILGETYMKNADWKKASESYQTIIDKYGYSQCWDPRGWFWKPAVASRGKLNKLLAEHGAEMGK